MYQEDKLNSFWTWTEVITTFVILSSVIIKIMIGRVSNPPKALQGSRVMISNSCSDLSQALKSLLEEKYDCKVLLVDFSKISDGLNPNQCNEKLDNALSTFGPVNLVIHNDFSAKDDFISQEDTNIREFLNMFMMMIPKMHLTGGGQIVNIKSNPSSVRALIESRKDYHELAQNLIQNIPSSGSNFSLSIIQTSFSSNYGCLCRANKIIDAIISRKPVIRLTNEQNLLEKVTELARKGLNTVGVSV